MSRAFGAPRQELTRRDIGSPDAFTDRPCRPRPLTSRAVTAYLTTMANSATPSPPNIGNRLIDFFAGLVPRRFRTGIPVVPVVRLTGVIGVVTPLRPGILLSTVARSLERAFDVPNARAVALIINSPGGSPAQSHLIFRRIRQLAEEKHLPVLAFVEDVGASGGYMLACAADEIICDQFSIVGSIGVVGGTFGVPKLMEKLGIERRLYTSGDRKVMLDPFLPEKPEDVKRIKAIQREIHDHFIALVKARRTDKLRGSEKTLFSGEFWTAQKAIELGLADRVGDLRSTLRERFGEKVHTPLISAERSLFGRRLPGVGLADALTRQPGLADDLVSALETRALWGRYGL
jgi:signal peptide peptidase SppA